MEIYRHEHCVDLRNEWLSAVVYHTAGGKIAKLSSLRSGRQFFYQDERSERTGNGYDLRDQSGWDECLPAIRPCPSPAGLHRGQDVPDHGFVIDQHFSAAEDDGKLRMRASHRGIEMERAIWLDRNRLFSEMTIRNTGREPFLYLTASHILFQWEPSLEVVLPPAAAPLYVYRCMPSAEIHPGTWKDSGFWKQMKSPFQCKVFTRPLNTGEILMKYKDEALTIRFDARQLPYAGLWLDKSTDARRPDCFSIQPTNYPSATLPPQEWAGTLPLVEAGSAVRWCVELSVEAEAPESRTP